MKDISAVMLILIYSFTADRHLYSHTGETEYFNMVVTVDCYTAPSLAVDRDKIDDILVLHLEGGKDFFVSFSPVI